MRTFETGATRSPLTGKIQYEGYLSPLVLRRFGEYMLTHSVQADGSQRAADNWQRGIPQAVYLDSLLRHVVEVWVIHRGHEGREGLQDALCGVLFNAQGYLHEELLGRECGHGVEHGGEG